MIKNDGRITPRVAETAPTTPALLEPINDLCEVLGASLQWSEEGKKAVCSKDGKSISTSSGLLFTVVSDLFLVIIKPQYKLVAMIFFSFAQLSYFIRLLYSDSDKNRRIKHTLIRISASLLAIILTLAVLRDKTDALSLVSMFYYAYLTVNIVYAFIHCNDSLIFAVGLVFFILCDTVVGLSVMDGMYFDFAESSLIYRIIHSDINLIWLFYVPSQTLIALSSFELKLKSKGEKQGTLN